MINKYFVEECVDLLVPFLATEPNDELRQVLKDVLEDAYDHGFMDGELDRECNESDAYNDGYEDGHEAALRETAKQGEVSTPENRTPNGNQGGNQ